MSENKSRSEREVEVSVVMPCLNEARTIVACIQEIQQTFEELGAQGEVVVSDNGSTDGSVLLAEQHGAVVVHEDKRGYGNACQAGMRAARGKYIFKMDADGTYVPADIGAFLKEFNKGYDYVIGSRLKGNILSGAMPISHRYLGNPVMSISARLLCSTGISDLCCGLKAFTREAFASLEFTSPGMVFGPETTIRSRQKGLKIAEVPITYRPDSREGHTNLNRYRDGINNMLFIFRESFLFKHYARRSEKKLTEDVQVMSSPSGK